MKTNSLPPPTRIGLLSDMYPPKPTWTTGDVPDLKGKVMIVTGGNTGLGKETCRVLLIHGAKVYLAARSERKANDAIQELEEKTGKTAIFLRLDLADLPSIRKTAEEFMSKEKHLHVLFNNAGVMVPPIEVLTAQGYDAQFGTNVLGPFFFTNLLFPVLLSTAKGENGGTPCKGNILIANELAQRYGDQGIVSISLHPGGVKTDLQRHVSGSIFKWILAKLIDLVLYDVSLGALTQLYAGTSEEAENMNGEYLTAWARRQVPNKHATDPELMAKLWKWCEEQVKDF
ncbi:NAD-P-binding protein [Artomyces pyxidatus]|uniref:NAD-P-binding protein n=1 Tax=Artomyces pyxidatus TaxID=48021 RepID=A0ACB8THP7_9AGAM|nr:NAD-P-binding protein [Artomyces pyxidatus]